MGTDLHPPEGEGPDPVLAGALAHLRDTPPPADLWPGIAPRLLVRAPQRLVQLRWPTALAAALALVAGSAGLTTWLGRAGRDAPPTTEVGQGVATTGVVAAAMREAGTPALTTAIDELTLALEAALSQLDPATRAQIREALASLDTAIAEANAVVRAAPDNRRAVHYLAATLSRKRDVLRTLVATATRS